MPAVAQCPPMTQRIRHAFPALLGLALMAAAAPARAEDGGVRRVAITAQTLPASGCLSRLDSIRAVQSGKAMPLVEARVVAEKAARGEMINAALCVEDGRLRYEVTVLAASGRVARALVDAQTGRLLGVK